MVAEKVEEVLAFGISLQDNRIGTMKRWSKRHDGAFSSWPWAGKAEQPKAELSSPQTQAGSSSPAPPSTSLRTPAH